MCAVHPFLTPIRELRHALSSLRLNDLQVGEDGRNRYLLSAFASKTGRNQPSNTKSIFGPAVWLRGLIKPPKGRAIAYLDYEQQEFGIAAALSGDEAMLAAYISGDPYLAFAKQAGAVPADATKDSHPQERRQFKECALGVQYGMSARSLAVRLREPEVVARRLLRLHRETYARFWEWSEAQVDSALLGLPMQTVFGWTLRAGNDPNPRSLANFPMQANGAEMLRLACCLATERGIMVCAPVHDALLIEAPIDEIESAVEATESYMREASQIVLDGFEIRTEAKAIRYPDRYQDERGAEMWSVVMGILDELESLP
jgi:DNA polymerase I-like protein with 3'-5' exonuclease and polymerase domains